MCAVIVRFLRGSAERDYIAFLRRECLSAPDRRILLRALLAETPIQRWNASLTKARAAYHRGVRRGAHRQDLT